MKTTLIIFAFVIIYSIAYLTSKDIERIQYQQEQIHQQDSIKWVNINNRFNK